MPLYTGIDGAVKELTSLYTGVDGARRELIELWAPKDGAEKKIFSKKPVRKLMAYTAETNKEYTVNLIQGREYEIYIVSGGGNGGPPGFTWGLYHGGGGGAGGTGAILHFKVLIKESSVIYFKSQNDGELTVTIGVKGLRCIAGHVGQVGENAGAFNPNPQGGYGGVGGRIEYLGSELNPDSFAQMLKSEGLDVTFIEYYSGTQASGRAGNRYGQKAPEPPKRTEVTNPPYIAEANQEAYSSNNPDSFCWGQAAGGRNSGTGGGASGGIAGCVVYAF